MQKLKIGFVLDDSLDSTDGVQQYVINVSQWLIAHGHEIHYLVGKTERTDLPNIHSLSHNVKVSFNQNRMSVPLPSSRIAIKKLLRREKFDVLHIQMPYSPFLAGRIIKAAPKKTAVVGTFHVAPYGSLVYFANRLLGKLVKPSLKRFDELISVSALAQDFAKKTFGIDSQVIPNTIELKPFFESKPIEKYGDSFNIMFFGRLVERKGCQHFLKAIYELKRTGSLPAKAKVIICGKGPMLIQLQEYVSQHGLEQITEFAGYISEDDKPSYLASADVLVYPSTGGESFGIVLLEGMAASRGAVLAGNNPGYMGVMGDQIVQTFNPNSEEDFAAKLREFISSPKKRQEAVEWQQTYVKRYSPDIVCKQITKVYSAALHKRPR